MGYPARGTRMLKSQRWGHEEDSRYDEFLLEDITLIYEVDLIEDSVRSIRKSSVTTENAVETGKPFSVIIKEAILLYILPESRQRFAENLSISFLCRQYAQGNREIVFQFLSSEMTGTNRWYEETIRLFRDNQTGHICAMLYVRDIQEYKIRELAIAKKAELDSLTGLFNRGAMQCRVEDLLEEFEKCPSMTAMLLIDIDNFKQVNDTYGHAYGDQVLCRVAHLLEDFFPNAVIGRFGGDEFLVFGEPLAVRESLDPRLQALCDSLAKMLYDIKCMYRVSASIGAAVYPDHGQNYHKLFERADEAQYQAKRTGKNGYSVYGEHCRQQQTAKFVGPEWLLDEISEAIYVCDIQTDELLYVNQAMIDWFGLEREQLRGRKCYEYILHRTEHCPACPRVQIEQDKVFVREQSVDLQGVRHLLRLKTKLVQWNGRSAQLEVMTDVSRADKKK